MPFALKTLAIGISMTNEPTKNPAAVALGRLGGLVKSQRKAETARLNGKRGGRPKKVRQVAE